MPEPLITNDPKVLRSELTERWWVVTKWRKEGDRGGIRAVQKFDITDQIKAILVEQEVPHE